MLERIFADILCNDIVIIAYVKDAVLSTVYFALDSLRSIVFIFITRYIYQFGKKIKVVSQLYRQAENVTLALKTVM
jgi:hypothetical protein